MQQVDTQKWNTIYPRYISAKHKVSEGRKVKKDLAVENPQLQEIVEILSLLKIVHCVEPMKTYSKDILEKGRVKVMLKDSNKNFVHPEIHTKSQLLAKLCELIPKLKTRKSTDQTAQSSAKSKKKKDKKKKR